MQDNNTRSTTLSELTFNGKEQEILVDIAIFVYENSTDRFTLKALCSFIHMNRHNPILCKVIRDLVYLDIFQVIAIQGTLKYYTANKKKLRDYVDELPLILKINEEYNARYHVRPY